MSPFERHKRQVHDDEIDGDPAVAAAKQSVSEAVAAHRTAVEAATPLRELIASIDLSVNGLRRELEGAQEQLAPTCAAVVLREVGVCAERALRERITELNQSIERFRLAHPILEQRRKEAQRPVASAADRLYNAEERLRRVRDEVRERIARGRV